MDYQPHLEDIATILFTVLDAPARLQALACHAQTDADLMRQVLDQAGKFVAERIAPLQRVGDEVGCRWEAGSVTTPPGFKAAYQAFWQAGWPALACAPQHGGQGLPIALEAILYEMLSAANHGWTMAPGLLPGAYDCLAHHGSDALKLAYLDKLASGEWLATMCLTEAHAGSDLGLVRTRATAQPDASYRLAGTKIFISGGEHDLCDNIVHLVLARLPEAAAGTKGLSLFLAPKFLPGGARNTIVCERIEEKMGLHGSPTCVLRFDDACAWLVGKPNCGLQAMFVMMNAARLHVAMQGLGLLDAAWQKADAYARERRQLRAPQPPGAPGGGPDLIAGHPAIRRILDTQRAWIDGGRVLAYQTALELDLAKHHPDAAQRASAQRWCTLVTPVLKAAFTQQAFHGASECLQVLGGHGYVREWGLEQIVRDARVTMIYEGTNEIQAIDLLLRKVLADGGSGLGALLAELGAALDAREPDQSVVLRRFAALQLLTAKLVSACRSDATMAYWVAEDFLRATALALMGWAWMKILTRTKTQASQARYAGRWLAPADALRRWVLPEFDMRLSIIARRIAGDTGATLWPALPA